MNARPKLVLAYSLLWRKRANLLAIVNNTTTRFIFDAEGTMHAVTAGGVSTFGENVTVAGDHTVAGVTKRANFGGYYWSAQGTAAVASAGAFVKVSTASSTTASETSNFTITTDNRATYTGGTTQKFIVSYQFTCTGQNNQIAAFRIAKNGTTIAGSEVARKIGTGLDEGATAVHFIVELATNDYVELWATNQDGTGNVFVEHGVLLITEA